MTNTVLYKRAVGTVFQAVRPLSCHINLANSVDVTAEGPNSLKYGPHGSLVQNGICHPVILLLMKVNYWWTNE